MATTNFSTYGDSEELRGYFHEILKEIGFVAIYEEEWETGFKVMGADRKRASPFTATLMNMFIGNIKRNRIVIELETMKENSLTVASLTFSPYLDVVDIKSPDKNVLEIERCEKLVGLVFDKIQERFMQQTPSTG